MNRLGSACYKNIVQVMIPFESDQEMPAFLFHHGVQCEWLGVTFFS